MNEKPYPFTLSRTEYRYEFVSVSLEKEVRKIVLLSQTDAINIFNLALLDVLEDGETSDISETRNDDLKTVLATVIQIINTFLTTKPNCLIAFKGSDQRRQRLYRIVISRELSEIRKKFDVFGGIGNTIHLFESNKQFDYYLIQKL
ncbi:DUF6934 family protein [Dyadobacter frigoris]|uniref:Uncharacterized protein n=1 Tax=Dyadobacter frigoris TaxID=2576211 RepID=A0A4U6D688_9BACT|nr:hypothetical protein [Dyadobacter frigoris]TKT91618.1 hypothetical protein FDK13_14730 [Dyadobacter frigoris]GLU51821.1 hypothetical protein Dfri01_12820 [Dyadobacter frigoris]